jgi:hypothetical protein
MGIKSDGAQEGASSFRLHHISQGPSFHAVKRKYTNKRLNFTTSTEARLPPGVIFQSRNRGWQDAQRASLDISLLAAEYRMMLCDLESKHQLKTENTRQETERRKKKET